jgi:hypothetical protein
MTRSNSRLALFLVRFYPEVLCHDELLCAAAGDSPSEEVARWLVGDLRWGRARGRGGGVDGPISEYHDTWRPPDVQGASDSDDPTVASLAEARHDRLVPPCLCCKVFGSNLPS